MHLKRPPFFNSLTHRLHDLQLGRTLTIARYPHSTHRGLALKVIRLAFNLLTQRYNHSQVSWPQSELLPAASTSLQGSCLDETPQKSKATKTVCFPVHLMVQGTQNSPDPMDKVGQLLPLTLKLLPSLLKPPCIPQVQAKMRLPARALVHQCASPDPVPAACPGAAFLWLILSFSYPVQVMQLISISCIFFFPCHPLFIKHNITHQRTANKNLQNPTRTLLTVMFGDNKQNALKNIGYQNSSVSTVFAWTPHPQVGFLFFVFVFFGIFHVTSISVFISHLFHFQVYHGKCTDFFC